jgi:hypothetical protein
MKVYRVLIYESDIPEALRHQLLASALLTGERSFGGVRVRAMLSPAGVELVGAVVPEAEAERLADECQPDLKLEA